MMTSKTSEIGSTKNTQPLNDANRLGLDFWAEAPSFADVGPIIDPHTHVSSYDAANVYFDVADRFGIKKTFTMTGIENVADVQRAAADRGEPERIEFTCVPSYARRNEPGTFTDRWLENIRQFRELGSRVIKFWAAPRGRDMHEDALLLDSPIRQQGMKLAYDLGYRVFMTHVADPDTWFATKYRDASHYGHKPDHYPPLERVLERYPDVTWIGAHMAGSPEDLDFAQGLLDRHPNYVVDTAATKWMTRELSKHPKRFAAFCQANPGRVLFGSDIVANDENLTVSADDPPGKPEGGELYASRYWALRTLIETGYAGPNPIVDPDLPMVDPSVAEKSTAQLNGAALPPQTQREIYHDAAARILDPAP